MNFLKTITLSYIILLGTFLYSQEVQIGLGAIDEGSIEVTMNTPLDVGGFQFDVPGASLTGGSGGLAQDAGFTVSTGAETVLGFSFTGSVIPAGSSGILTNLSGTFSDDVCLSMGTGAISDSNGQALETTFGEDDCEYEEPEPATEVTL